MADWFASHLVDDAAKRGWLFYRLAPGHSAEIVNIEVLGAHRRTGVGKAMLDAMLVELPADVGSVFAFTRRSNRIARLWYESLGFRGTVVVDFYGDDDPDAALYVLRI